MLLPGGHFHFNGPITIPVKDPKAAGRWYEVVLNMNCTVDFDMVPTGMYNPMDAANPQPQIVFSAAPEGPIATQVTKHPVIFARNIHEAHKWFSKQTSTTGSIQIDSGGNLFFVFRDLDGNRIEVCADPS